MSRIRILIADDHAILRTGLRMLINAQPDMEFVAEAESGRDAVRLVAELQPDVIIMDITMPGLSGIQAIGMIRQKNPHVKALIFTMHDDPTFVRTALAVGAKGYITKRAADTELLNGIRSVFQGNIFIDPALTAMVVDTFLTNMGPKKNSDDSGTSLLSPRERQVLQLISQGFTNLQIADRLFISIKTVETHRARVTKKLGLRDRADFVRYAMETGLTTSADSCESL